MNLNRRDFLKSAFAFPAAAWLANYLAMAASSFKAVKITAIKAMGIDNVADGCLVRIETDAGLVGYGEAGLPAPPMRSRIENGPATHRTRSAGDRAPFLSDGSDAVLVHEALGDEIDIAMHCTGQFDTRSAIGLCKAIEPADPLWIEDPLTVRYSEAWLELKRSTRVPVLAGEKVELVEGFRPYLDHQALDMIHPDVAYSGGITGCRRIADYADLTRTPMGMHSGPCSLVRFYASMQLGAAVENFFKVENALGAFRGNKEKMAQGPEPSVRKSVFQVPEGPGLGLEINEDWLRSHVAKGETWWG